MSANACYDLFNEIVSISGYMASNGRMRVIKELERMWEKVVVTKNWIQSWQLPG
jgi:hypothetical protein